MCTTTTADRPPTLPPPPLPPYSSMTTTTDDIDQLDDQLLYSATSGQTRDDQQHIFSSWRHLHFRGFSAKIHRWLIVGIILIVAHVVHNFTPPPAPLKLLQVGVYRKFLNVFHFQSQPFIDVTHPQIEVTLSLFIHKKQECVSCPFLQREFHRVSPIFTLIILVPARCLLFILFQEPRPLSQISLDLVGWWLREWPFKQAQLIWTTATKIPTAPPMSSELIFVLWCQCHSKWNVRHGQLTSLYAIPHLPSSIHRYV